MTFWFRWREVRVRFLVLAAFTAFASLMVAGYTADHVSLQLAQRDAAGQLALRLHRISSEWFGNKGPSVAVLLGAIFLAAGGPMTEPGRGSTLFAAALPVARRRLLLNQIGVATLLVLGLALVGAAGAIVGGLLVGVRYPVLPALAGALVQTVGALPFAGLLVALQAATRRAIGSTVALLAAALVLPQIASDLAPAGRIRLFLSRLEFPPMIPWEPRTELHLLSGTSLVEAMPWPALGAALAVALAGSAVAFAVFERREL